LTRFTPRPSYHRTQAEPFGGVGRTGRPVVIEVAGTPRAGKTTVIAGLTQRFERAGRQVRVVAERARERSWLPNKRDPNFNLLTFSATVQAVVEARHRDGDIVLVDRGMLDALVWNEWHFLQGKLTEEEHCAYDRSLRTRLLARQSDLVVLMTVDPDEAMRRDGWIAGSPVGSIMNPDSLRLFNGAVETIVRRNSIGGEFQLVHVDTTDADEDATLDRVTGVVVAFLGGRLPLSVPRPRSRPA
jgi:AAA domain